MNKPQSMVLRSKSNLIWSFRWAFINFDIIKKQDFFFVQYGSRPVKFICWVKKNSRPPLFLMSWAFKTTATIKTFFFGHTDKPVDVAKFWRKLCKNNTSAHYTPTNTKTSLGTNYGTIAITAKRD